MGCAHVSRSRSSIKNAHSERETVRGLATPFSTVTLLSPALHDSPMVAMQDREMRVPSPRRPLPFGMRIGFDKGVLRIPICCDDRSPNLSAAMRTELRPFGISVTHGHAVLSSLLWIARGRFVGPRVDMQYLCPFHELCFGPVGSLRERVCCQCVGCVGETSFVSGEKTATRTQSFWLWPPLVVSPNINVSPKKSRSDPRGSASLLAALSVATAVRCHVFGESVHRCKRFSSAGQESGEKANKIDVCL